MPTTAATTVTPTTAATFEAPMEPAASCSNPLRIRPGASSGSGGSRSSLARLPLSSNALLTHHHDASPTTGRMRMRASLLSGLLHRRGGASAGKGDALTLLSTAMGYVVIAGSMLFKVPQAVRIFRKKSAEGLSASMYILETAGIAMSLAFSMKNAFPFSTYGEAVFILLQNVAIMAGAWLVWLRGGREKENDGIYILIFMRPSHPPHHHRHLGLQRHAQAARAHPLAPPCWGPFVWLGDRPQLHSINLT